MAPALEAASSEDAKATTAFGNPADYIIYVVARRRLYCYVVIAVDCRAHTQETELACRPMVSWRRE
jgi:hypothetical protein